MPVSERDEAVLAALAAAGSQDPDLSAYYEFHRALFQVLAEAKAGISATLEMVDAQALEARLLQGLPVLSFDQLPVEAGRFAALVSMVAERLAEYDGELAEQAVPDTPAECLALARQRFEVGQVGQEPEQTRQSQDKITLAQLSVDLALKPSLEWAAEQVLPHVDQELWKRRYCPVCGGAPDLAFLEEKAGARYLLCSRCSSQWGYRRLGCVHCATDEYSKLMYYPSKDGVYRLYVCQNCKRYLKVMDMRKVGRRVLFPVERITTLAMDLAAQEEGYR